MDDLDRVTEIKKKLEQNAYFVNPHSDANINEDFAFLMKLIEQRDQKIAQLEKKNEVLLTQVMDLNQEIENVKSDFGGMR